LVQDSLENYTQMIIDACVAVKDLKTTMKWPGNILVSPYL